MKVPFARAITSLGVGIVVGTAMGCGWAITPPTRDFPPVHRRIAPAAVLIVNEAAIAWGGGSLGSTVQHTLVSLGCFDQVFYPVEPRNPPPLRIQVEARGDVDEEIALGVLKSFVTGLLLFIPVGIFRYDMDFDLDAHVLVTRDGQEVQRFEVKTSTGVSHTMFSKATGYEPPAREAAFRDLGERIAFQLSTVEAIPP